MHTVECQSEVKFTSLLLRIGQNILFFVKNFSLKNVRKPSVYKALSCFCVIITTVGSNKVHTGVKSSNFGNIMWFLLSVIVEIYTA